MLDDFPVSTADILPGTRKQNTLTQIPASELLFHNNPKLFKEGEEVLSKLDLSEGQNGYFNLKCLI